MNTERIQHIEIALDWLEYEKGFDWIDNVPEAIRGWVERYLNMVIENKKESIRHEAVNDEFGNMHFHVQTLREMEGIDKGREIWDNDLSLPTRELLSRDMYDWLKDGGARDDLTDELNELKAEVAT